MHTRTLGSAEQRATTLTQGGIEKPLDAVQLTPRWLHVPPSPKRPADEVRREKDGIQHQVDGERHDS